MNNNKTDNLIANLVTDQKTSFELPNDIVTEGIDLIATVLNPF